MTSTSLALGTLEAAKMVHMLDPQAIVMLDGALTIEVEDDRVTVSAFMRVGLNFSTLPSEGLHTLQGGVIMELRSQEQCSLNVISEQKAKNDQLDVHKNYTIDLLKAIIENNEHITKVVAKACTTVPELDIPEDAPVDVRIQKLATRVHQVRTEMSKVQF